VRQARARHDFTEGDTSKSTTIEQLTCAVNDVLLYCRSMTGGTPARTAQTWGMATLIEENKIGCIPVVWA
jgi:hypothetical protein